MNAFSHGAATLHAIALLAMPIASIAAAILLCRHKPSQRAVGWSLLGGFFLLFAAGPIVFSCLCDRGSPIMQPLVGAISIVVAGIGISNPALRTLACAIFVPMTFALSWHYQNLVHHDSFTGNPKMAPIYLKAHMKANLSLFGEETQKAVADSQKSYPAGWLKDSELAKGSPELQELFKKHPGRRVEAYSFWHTAFTRIHELRAFPTDVWYPGGPVSEAANRLEWRDRVSQ